MATIGAFRGSHHVLRGIVVMCLKLHSTCRGCALITVICSIISSNITHEINCQV